jgi:hypothetical protein
MRRFTISSILSIVAVLMAISCSGPKKTPQEENVLNALTHIRQSVEADIAYEQFINLLSQAKIQIDVLKGTKENNPCFVGAIEKCYASYTIAGKAWKKKMEATDDNRRADMDLTLSFSLSFGALSIQNANNCFDKKHRF